MSHLGVVIPVFLGVTIASTIGLFSLGGSQRKAPVVQGRAVAASSASRILSPAASRLKTTKNERLPSYATMMSRDGSVSPEYYSAKESNKKNSSINEYEASFPH